MAAALLWVAATGQAAPLVEINQPAVHLSLAPYVDILEDVDGKLTIEDVLSERYAYQFAPAPLTELFFGYTSSTYWLRITVENQRDVDMNFVLEAVPADIDYIDLYQIDPHTNELRSHVQMGSALPYESREYRSPLYFFDLAIEAHAAYSYYLRVESNKTLNLQLNLNTPREHWYYNAIRSWWQAYLLGALCVIGVIHLGLFALLRFRTLLWSGLFVWSFVIVQACWNGYLLSYFEPDDLLLDRQILSPVYLSILFSMLFVQSLLNTKQRSPVQHHLFNLLAGIGIVGAVVTWFTPSYVNSMVVSLLAVVSTVAVFAATLHANMEGMVMARHFLLARTFTSAVILIGVFNIHGYLPQGAFASWGIAAAIVLEGVIMGVSMVYGWLHIQRGRNARREEAVDEPATQSLVNLADICHELRTPISGVLGMTDLLLDGALSEQQRNQVKTLRKSGQALLDIANKMADLSSIESGAVELVVAPFELPLLVEFCVENCRSRAEFNNVELIYNVDSRVPAFLKGDQEKLQQIVINLLHFALRHLEQGEVVFAVSMTETGQVHFSIHSGHSSMLHERSMPKSQVRDTQAFGSGDNLNLTIAEQYVKLMGGSLSLQSYVDGGFSVEFSLLLEEQKMSMQHTLDDGAILQGKRLLVVDDNLTCCAVIEQQATQWGMRVETASGGKEALAILRAQSNLQQAFDVVLIDYDMPGMNGLELAAHIQEDAHILRDNMLLVMLTGVSKAPNKMTAGSGNIQRVLYKPLSGKSLRLALQEILQQART